VESAAAAGADDVDGVGGELADYCEGGCVGPWSMNCTQGRDESSYAQAIRNDIAGTCPGLCDVLAKWDDVHDMKRFAMYAAKLDSLYGIE